MRCVCVAGVNSTVIFYLLRPPTAISRVLLGTLVTTYVGEKAAGTFVVTRVPARVAEIALRCSGCIIAMKTELLMVTSNWCV